MTDRDPKSCDAIHDYSRHSNIHSLFVLNVTNFYRYLWLPSVYVSHHHIPMHSAVSQRLEHGSKELRILFPTPVEDMVPKVKRVPCSRLVRMCSKDVKRWKHTFKIVLHGQPDILARLGEFAIVWPAADR